MFNALWLNSQELDGNGVIQRVITLSAIGAAGATAAAPVTDLRRGLKATVTAGATGSASHIAKRKPLSASVTVGAEAGDAVFSPIRNMYAHGYVLTDGFLGSSFPIFLAADATAGATGILYPFDKLFDATASAGASATASLTKTQFLGGTGALNVTVADAATSFNRQCFGDVSVGASATAVPDYTVGGVRYAGLAANPHAGAEAENTIDPKKALYGIGSVLTTAYTTGTLARTIELLSNPQQGGARVYDPVALRADVTMLCDPALVTATATARAARKTNIRGTGLAGAKATISPRISTQIFLNGTGLAGVPIVDVNAARRRGLKVFAMAGASATPAGLGIADKLYGYAEITISAEDVGYFTTRTLGAAPILVGADASADMKPNLYDREPDFRTLQVDTGDWTDEVEPEDWTLSITDDNTAMKKFEKQPADVLAYDIDFTTWFDQIPQDDIVTASCSVVTATDNEPSNLSVDSVIKVSSTLGGPAKIAKVWLSGGLDGVTYKLTLTVVTEDGRTKEQDFKMKVKEI